MKLVVTSLAVVLVLAMPAVAAAQSAPASPCPPGSWFCAPPADAQTGAGKSGLAPLPDPEDEAPPPPRQPRVTYEPAPSSAPPVVVYQPPAPVMVERPETPPPYEYNPPPRKPISPGREWGLNLHLEGAALGSGANHNANMDGLGAGLRYKPMRYLGLEVDIDHVGGHGYVGDNRDENALSFNALAFLNPKDRAQLYLLAGFGWQWAHSTSDPSDSTPQTSFDNHYTYFGGQIGVGLELRLTRVLAFNVDLRGFVRTRTDQQAQFTPEFTSSTGQTTNSSGGVLLTGGMTLYF